MRIMFICGSLQPGRDGVGDYTRRLAAELLRQNHQVGIISLNDRQLVEQVSEDIQQDEEQFIKTLRLSNRLSWVERVRRASAFVKTLNPDWISLQYVPFAFQDKGLPFNLTSIIKRLRGDRPMHIMFHELWVGMSMQSSKKHVWWGMAQRHLVRSLLTALRPNVVHTHTPLYGIHLSRLGIQASLLPLFANISVVNSIRNGSEQYVSKTQSHIGFVLFGGIFPGSPVDELASEVAAYAKEKQVAVDLTIIGRSGPEQETWCAAWHAHGLAVRILGEQSPESISNVLSQSSIGLSTTPMTLSGKSGTIAAMHAHGLPVLCVSLPWYPRDVDLPSTTPGIMEYTAGNLAVTIDKKGSMNPSPVYIANVTSQLIIDLLAVSGRGGTSKSPSTALQHDQ